MKIGLIYMSKLLLSYEQIKSKWIPTYAGMTV